MREMFCSNCGKKFKRDIFNDMYNIQPDLCCSNACLKEILLNTKNYNKPNYCGICNKQITENWFASGASGYHITCFHKHLKSEVKNGEAELRKLEKKKNDLIDYEEEFKDELVVEKL
jgi:NMD protein affecting ribosome stability and mRNA decay